MTLTKWMICVICWSPLACSRLVNPIFSCLPLDAHFASAWGLELENPRLGRRRTRRDQFHECRFLFLVGGWELQRATS